MSANVGDRIHMHSNSVDTPDRVGTIVGVLGSDDGPPYRVRFESGEETIVSPGPDATIEPAAERPGAPADAGHDESAETITGAAARIVSDVADTVAKRLGQ